MTQVVDYDRLTAIESERTRAVELIEEFISALTYAAELRARAEAAIARACGGSAPSPHDVAAPHQPWVLDPIKQLLESPAPKSGSLASMTKLTDARIWYSLLAAGDLRHLLDATAKQELRKQLAYDPNRPMPEVNADNLRATIEDWRDRAGDLFLRGLATAFSTLDRRFRSHDGFKFGHRIIINGAFNESGALHVWAPVETVDDVERMLRLLNGGQAVVGPDFENILQIAERERGRWCGAKASRHENEWFDLRVFKNGNAHLRFKRAEDVDRVNYVLAEYYGEVLPAAPPYKARSPGFAEPSAVAEIVNDALARGVRRAKNLGYYPTPDPVVSRMVSAVPDRWRAALMKKGPDRSAWPRALEPSAGDGALIRALREHFNIAEVDAVEIDEERARALRTERDDLLRVFHADFLDLASPTLGQYDLILMNPPFDRGQDALHVLHATRFLSPGGILVAVTSAGLEYSSARSSRDLRSIASRWALSGREGWHDLPMGSFEPATSVNTRLLAIQRPGSDL